MIETLKFYKLCTLQEVYEDYLDDVSKYPRYMTFGNYVNILQQQGWRIQ